MSGYPLTVLVTVLSLLVYTAFSFAVGRARMRHGVQAPAMDGPPEFQRAMRVQANTLEQIVLFLPALWLFAAAWGDRPAALIGIVWPLARIVYGRAYVAEPAKRGPGFIVAMLVSLILLLGAAVRALDRVI